MVSNGSYYNGYYGYPAASYPGYAAQPYGGYTGGYAMGYPMATALNAVPTTIQPKPSSQPSPQKPGEESDPKAGPKTLWGQYMMVGGHKVTMRTLAFVIAGLTIGLLASSFLAMRKFRTSSMNDVSAVLKQAVETLKELQKLSGTRESLERILAKLNESFEKPTLITRWVFGNRQKAAAAKQAAQNVSSASITEPVQLSGTASALTQKVKGLGNSLNGAFRRYFKANA